MEGGGDGGHGGGSGPTLPALLGAARPETYLCRLCCEEPPWHVFVGLLDAGAIPTSQEV